MADTRVTNPLVAQFKRGGIPHDLRLMAAQGALPLNPADLAELLHHLLGDVEPGVSAAADKTLTTMPAEEMLPLLKDRGSPPELLAWALSRRQERELREA